jgi:hypothetical protein
MTELIHRCIRPTRALMFALVRGPLLYLLPKRHGESSRSKRVKHRVKDSSQTRLRHEDSTGKAAISMERGRELSIVACHAAVACPIERCMVAFVLQM